MKTKTKTKNKTKKTASPRTKKYQAHYLALILVGVLLLEGILIGSTSRLDWARGAEILDVSGGVSEVGQEMAAFFRPMAETYDAVNQFYVAAAVELTPVLDMSQGAGQVLAVLDGVNEFYNQAATQMAYLLDVSSVSNWPARVAGVSITVDH